MIRCLPGDTLSFQQRLSVSPSFHYQLPLSTGCRDPCRSKRATVDTCQCGIPFVPLCINGLPTLTICAAFSVGPAEFVGGYFTGYSAALKVFVETSVCPRDLSPQWCWRSPPYTNSQASLAAAQVLLIHVLLETRDATVRQSAPNNNPCDKHPSFRNTFWLATAHGTHTT